MNIQSLPVGGAFMSLNLAPHCVLVRSSPDRRSGLANIILRTAGKELEFARFADARLLDLGPRRMGTSPSLGAELRFVGLPGGVVLLLGVKEVVALNPDTGAARNVLERFRQDSDDHGFYREELIELSNGVVLVYEGGAARFSNGGERLWHCALTWNDTLVRADQQSLHFVGEEPDGSSREWSLDLSDGSKR